MKPMLNTKKLKLKTKVLDILQPKLTGVIVSKPFKMAVEITEDDNCFYAIKLDKGFYTPCKEHYISVLIMHHSNLGEIE
jgi:hypothetical protein